MSTQIIPGSLQAIAQSGNMSIAESFINCDNIIIVDVSASMSAVDSDEPEDIESLFARSRRAGPSRYDRACTELAALQQTLPGKIAVIAFSSEVEFCPAGIPTFLMGGTDMVKALRFVHVADDTGVKFILISDGDPQDRDKTLTVARTFKSKIDTVHIGPAGSPGADFLRRLAELSGGQSAVSSTVLGLNQNVQRLLGTS